jgi:hypothetical protein
LAVDPEALFAAGSAVVAAGDGVAANLTVLTGGFSVHTGLDPAGTVFGLAYQSAAEALLKAAVAAINACRHSGAKIQLGASNYSKAEAASTLGGGAGVLSPPSEPADIAPPGPPGTWGAGEPPPLLWAVVESFVDGVWPDGDVAGLHAAAARWRSFGAALSGMQGALDGSKSLIGAQQIAEGDQLKSVLSKIGENVNSIGAQCGKLAATLDDFANEVSHAQNAIRDLLHRLGSLADIAHDVVLIFEGDAIDEIKKIANDINAVLHNLGREGRAFEQSMTLGMQVIDHVVVEMEKFMRGEFTHFLGDQVGNAVANDFDTFINVNEGFFKGGVGMVQGIVALDPRWFLVDPKGATDTWMGMTKTSLLNHILNPQEAVEADKQMFKSLLHLDDWRSDRPGLGFGENVFDVATFFLPGVGEAGAGAKGAGAAAGAAEEGTEAATAAGTVGRGGEAAGELGELGELAGAGNGLGEIGKVGGGLTKDLQSLGDLPKIDPPISGSPVTLPTEGLPGAPVEAAPHPVETVPPGPHEPPAAPAGGPAGGPHEPPLPPAGGPAGGPHEPPSPTGEGAPHEAPSPPAGGPHEGSSVAPGPKPPDPPGGATEPPAPVSAPAGGPRDPAAPAEGAPHEPASPPTPAPAGGPHEPASAPAGRPQDPVAIPAGAPREPAWTPMAPSERLSSTNPQLTEPAPARVPVSPNGSPAQPAPAAAHSPESSSAPASSSPHASTPSSTPASGRPAELPAPHADSPHGHGHGGRPHRPHGHGGGPHGPGDGDPPGDQSPGQHGSRPGNDGTTGETPGGANGVDAPPVPPKIPGVDYAFPPADALPILERPGAELQRLADGGVPTHILEGYEPLGGQTVEEFKREFTIQDPGGKIRWDWDGQAPKNGFAGQPFESNHIPEDFRLDRLGSNGGGFMSAEGVPLAERAMPPGAATQYHVFEGTGREVPEGKGWVVQHGPAKDAFGQPGGADQWIVLDSKTGRPVPVDEVIQARLLREPNPPK